MDSVKIKIPVSVKREAQFSFKLKKLGFHGGTSTGWNRARQLAEEETITLEDLRNMKAWFARHVFTSYPGYKDWVETGKPTDDPKWHRTNSIIAWLIWGGSSGFRFVTSDANIKL